MCVQCTVQGVAGDGTQQGTCASGNVCNLDGKCSLCSATNSIPHGGCSKLNPICNGGTECVCDKALSTICTADIHSVCDGYAIADPFGGGSCLCGTTSGSGSNSVCSGNTPICKYVNFATPTDSTSTSATCQVNTHCCIQYFKCIILYEHL